MQIGVDVDYNTAIFGPIKDRPRIKIEGEAESKVEIRQPTRLTKIYIWPTDKFEDVVDCTFRA